ncbi:MAG: nuclear transport factor 2 family protein [Actinomycetota bacterium]
MNDHQLLHKLLAYEEIRQLVAKYAVALDSRRLGDLVELFVDDVEVGSFGRGHKALQASLEASLAPLGTTILSVANHVIELDGLNDASGEVYCSAELEQGEFWLRQRILYKDQYRHTPRGWKFVKRRHLLWYSAPLGVDPRTLPPANWPLSNIGMGTLPEALHAADDTSS